MKPNDPVCALGQGVEYTKIEALDIGRRADGSVILLRSRITFTTCGGCGEEWRSGNCDGFGCHVRHARRRVAEHDARLALRRERR